VAHGRRDRPKNNIEPLAAYERLSDFLDALGIAVEPELIEPEQLPLSSTDQTHRGSDSG
jgi:hypothetical protein